MKKLLILLLMLAGMAAVRAQEPHRPQAEGTIRPLRVEVAFNKTVHILFPAAVRYVDLGSTDLVAGKADGAENVLRIKAAVRGFEGQTNFSVITQDGVFYAFDAVYAESPARLSILMQAPPQVLTPGQDAATFVRLSELGDADPREVIRTMHRIREQDRRHIRNIGSRRFGVQFLLRGIYVRGELFFLHTSIRNASNIPYDIERIRFRIADRKVARRTALQETLLEPVRTLDASTGVAAGQTLHNVYVLRKFSIPDDKVLVVDLIERDGGRHLSFTVQHSDLTSAPATAEHINR